MPSHALAAPNALSRAPARARARACVGLGLRSVRPALPKKILGAGSGRPQAARSGQSERRELTQHRGPSSSENSGHAVRAPHPDKAECLPCAGGISDLSPCPSCVRARACALRAYWGPRAPDSCPRCPALRAAHDVSFIIAPARLSDARYLVASVGGSWESPQLYSRRIGRNMVSYQPYSGAPAQPPPPSLDMPYYGIGFVDAIKRGFGNTPHSKDAPAAASTGGGYCSLTWSVSCSSYRL